jgi:hypothetical protein
MSNSERPAGAPAGEALCMNYVKNKALLRRSFYPGHGALPRGPSIAGYLLESTSPEIAALAAAVAMLVLVLAATLSPSIRRVRSADPAARRCGLAPGGRLDSSLPPGPAVPAPLQGSRSRGSPSMPVRASCHCGKVACILDMDPIEAMQCNCSICRRKGYLLAFSTPDKFRLETSRDDVTAYTFGKHIIRHQFCRTCGCAPFGEGIGTDGQAVVAVNLRCVEGIDLRRIKIAEFDGAGLS